MLEIAIISATIGFVAGCILTGWGLDAKIEAAEQQIMRLEGILIERGP